MWPIGRKLGGPRSRSGRGGEEEISLLGIEPLSSCPFYVILVMHFRGRLVWKMLLPSINYVLVRSWIILQVQNLLIKQHKWGAYFSVTSTIYQWIPKAYVLNLFFSLHYVCSTTLAPLCAATFQCVPWVATGYTTGFRFPLEQGNFLFHRFQTGSESYVDSFRKGTMASFFGDKQPERDAWHFPL